MHNLEEELKNLIINTLNLEGISVDHIDSNEPLFGTGLGLDSIDALELGIMLRKKYGLKISIVDEDVKAHFATIHSLAIFIKSQQNMVS